MFKKGTLITCYWFCHQCSDIPIAAFSHKSKIKV